MDDSGRQRKRRRRAKDEGAGKKNPSGDRPCNNDNLIAALNHKLRRQTLRRLNRSASPLSPTNLSDEMEVPVGNVSYHMGVLRKCGAVSMVDERPVRGAVEHFFVSEVADNPAVQAMLDETKAQDEGMP